MVKKISVFDIHLGAEMKLRETRRKLIEAARAVVMCRNQIGVRDRSCVPCPAGGELPHLPLRNLHEMETCLKAYDQAEAAVAKTRQKVMDTTYGPIRKPPKRATRPASQRSSAPAKSRSKKSAPSTKPRRVPSPTSRPSLAKTRS